MDSQFCALKGEEQRGKREGQGASSKSVSARRQKSELATASLRPDWRYTRDARATLSYPKRSWSLDQQKKQSSRGVNTEFHVDKSEFSQSILRPTEPPLHCLPCARRSLNLKSDSGSFARFTLQDFACPFLITHRSSSRFDTRSRRRSRAAVWMLTHSSGWLSQLARYSCF